MIIALGTASPNANIDQIARYADQVTDVVRSFSETAQVIQINGYPASNNSITLMALKPWDQRKRTTMQLLPEVTQKLGGVAGMRLLSFLRPPLPGAGGANVQFIVVSTDDPSRIAQVADALVLEAVKSGLFFYADNSLKFDQAQAYIDVDRDKAAMFGITMAQVGSDIGAMLGGNYVNFFNVQGRSYRVVPQVDRVFRLNPEQLGNYYIGTGKGGLVPLSAVASIHYEAQPRSMSRFQQLNAATITCVPKPGVTQGQALEFLNVKARELFPEGYTADYAGQSRQFIQESGAFLGTMAFAVIIIFLVLAAQFESFRDPLIIMLSVPLAVSGALAFVCLGYHGLSLNIYTKVGLITLVGLVTKHGILITQFANQLQREGKPRRAAVEEAAGVRLRPILMTTAAMVLGVMPLVFASGAGAVSRQHMGLIIATGMSIGTLFTLFVVPTAYSLLARDHQVENAAPKEAVGAVPVPSPAHPAG
jgi:multidrug efflux pump